MQTAEPRVSLVAWTAQPFHTAVASARTCYAGEFVFVGRLGPKGEATRMSLEEALPEHQETLARIGDLDTPQDEREALLAGLLAAGDLDATIVEAAERFADLARRRAIGEGRIAQSIYEAGHHTPFQHPTFIFALEGVSRNVVESFFHNHTFYNSEQQSQRYVEMADAVVHIPASIQALPEAKAAYEEATRASWLAYHDLRRRLVASNEKVMGAIGRIKGQSAGQIHSEAEKKAQEMARYVLPIAARTQLYHTVSGIVLLRYVRMCEASGVPAEARQVVEAMVEAVRAVDPSFIEQVQETTRPRGEHLEWQVGRGQGAPPAWPHDADARSVLVHATPDGDGLVEQALAEVLGAEVGLERLLDPSLNAVWNDTLNTWDHSPALRTLRHVHLTYRKRLSLTAHAQDQRHRLTPGSRPQLHRAFGDQPDVYVPDVVTGDPEARAVYDEAIAVLWQAMATLRGLGVPAEDAAYLLPNAAQITFTQSGDLLSWIHKWRLRLCFNAQKEIFESSLEELRQAQAALPALTKFLGPPCTFVAAAQPPEKQDDVDACCPEGPRWCGVKVWKNFDAGSGRPKRPY
ncbi:MAG: FAD-dependent thymidylate synthase [Thermoplasmatota archaeon]